MTALQDRKGTRGRKRTAASVVAGICKGIIERRLRYLVYSGVLAAALCLPAGPAAAACDQFTPFGQPVSSNLLEDVGVATAPDRIVICHTGQFVAFNPARNVSDWVAFHLRREDLLNRAVERKDNFRPDPQRSGTAQGRSLGLHAHGLRSRSSRAGGGDALVVRCDER